MRNPYLQIDLVFTLILCLIGMSVLPVAASANTDSRVLICTSQGYQWVELNQSPQVQAEKEHCIFCLAAEDHDEPIASQADAWFLEYLPYSAPALPVQGLGSRKPTSQALSRAPPVHFKFPS